MTLIVSIVVPTCRRPHLLDHCLQALVSQHFPASAYEIIIVDDGPEVSATREIVTQWQKRLQENAPIPARIPVDIPPVAIPVTGDGNTAGTAQGYAWFDFSPIHAPELRYLPAWDTQGPAAARNLGWRSARGEIIAFTDDDCIPEPDWLYNGLSAFVGEVVGVSGQVIVPMPSDPTDNDRNTAGLERSLFVTANCFYRRSALESTGGFDERFTQAWREDSDLYFTLRERNLPLARATGAVVLHPPRPEPWGASLRQQRKSLFNALLYKKHPQLYWKVIQPSPPWHYYGIVLATLIVMIGLAAGSLPTAVISAVLWLNLTVRFILTRLRGTSHRPAHVMEMVLTSLAIPFLSVYWRLRGAIRWRVFFL